MDQWKTMMMLLLLFLFSVLPSLRAWSHRYASDYFLIDCGALNETSVTDDRYIKWETDQEFIKSGENKLLSTNLNPSIQLNTLRFFPKGGKNCYELHFYNTYDKFLFRAGFYYGNYDGLSKPPSFGLEIDGHLWANVTTSMSEEPVYHEVLYIAKGEQARVCLVRTRDDEVPFISSLVVHIIYDSYNFMDNNTALYLHSRINYGANTSVEYLFAENEPPCPVMEYAIQAFNVTDSIYLSVDFFPGKAVQAYFVLYFMDPVFRSSPNQTSRVEIYIDNNKMAVTDVPNPYGRSVDQYHVVSLFDVPVVGSANVTISPAEASTLAPLLNAMEVFSAIDVSDSEGVHFLYFSALLFVIFLHLSSVLASFW